MHSIGMVKSSIDVVENAADSDSDAAPEEESNVASRKQVKAVEKKRQNEKKRRSEERKRKALEKSKTRSAEGAIAGSGTASTDLASASKRLDPSLFAASFSQRASASSSSSSSSSQKATELSTSQAERLRQQIEAKRKAKRKGGIVQGRDGRPMRRLNDGQTVVRVLESSKARIDDEKKEESTKEETLLAPTLLPAAQALPSAKASKFKRQKLGLKEKSDNHTDKAKKTIKSAEDPLGLQDPAFMQGGEFEHLGLSAVRTKKRASPFKKTGRAAKGPSSLRRGDAGRRTNVSSGRHAIPTNFARSQMS